MSSKPVKQVRRSRVSVPKVRTGCLTCKIRHVKCGEEKPICFRCSSVGIVCDGYSTKQKPKVETKQQRQVTRFSPQTIASNPSVSPILDDQERRGFEYFQVRTVHCIGLASIFWDRLVLQFSQSDLTVRHAAIALGSLNERLQINNLLNSENVQANARHHFARRQYDKALAQLRKQICNYHEQPVVFTLVSCFLFLCFEFLQGNDEAALVHLRSGLNILRLSHAKGAGASGNGSPACLSDHDKFIRNITQAFVVADLMATRWLELPSSQTELLPPAGDPRPHSLDVESFSSLDEALEFLIEIGKSIHRLHRTMIALSIPELLDQIPPDLFSALQEVRVALDKWPVAMDAFRTQLPSGLSAKDEPRVKVLNIKYKVLKIMFTAKFASSEKATYERFDNTFKGIVTLSASLIRPVNILVNTKLRAYSNRLKAHDVLPLFDFTEGVIHALYFTAIKCCNRSTCREALSLLSSVPWREGAWDSAAMARVAERKVRQLEKGRWYSDTTVFLLRSPYIGGDFIEDREERIYGEMPIR